MLIRSKIDYTIKIEGCKNNNDNRTYGLYISTYNQPLFWIMAIIIRRSHTHTLYKMYFQEKKGQAMIIINE